MLSDEKNAPIFILPCGSWVRVSKALPLSFPTPWNASRQYVNMKTSCRFRRLWKPLKLRRYASKLIIRPRAEDVSIGRLKFYETLKMPILEGVSVVMGVLVVCRRMPLLTNKDRDQQGYFQILMTRIARSTAMAGMGCSVASLDLAAAASACCRCFLAVF